MATPTNDESNTDFYPENAQELNFASARKSAEENAAKDLETQSIGITDEAPADTTTADTTPEAPATDETAA